MRASLLCVALLGTGLSGVVSGLHAQSSTDSVHVYEAAIQSWATSSLSHPSGNVEAICVEALPDWFTFSRERSAPPLRPHHAEVILRALQDTMDVVASRGCYVAPREAVEIRGWMLDEDDRPAIRLMVSGLVFEHPDTVLLHVGMLAGALWGGGRTCRWVRTPQESWEQRDCSSYWDS